MDLAVIRQQKPLGKGSSRTVYPMGKYVAKVAHGRYKRMTRGLAQNRAEFEIWKYAHGEQGVTHLCPIKDIAPDDSVVIMARAIPASKPQLLPEHARDDLRLLKRRLRYMFSALCNARGPRFVDVEHAIETWSATYPRRKEEIRKTFQSKLWHDICVLVFDYGLALGDIIRVSSWGYYKGRFVLTDYGLTNSVLKRLYQTRRST